MLCSGNPVEDRVVGVILLGNKNHVLDLPGFLARDGRNDRGGHGIAIRTAVHDPVVGKHIGGHRFEFSIGRHIQHADNATHAEKITLGNVLARVGTIPKTTEANANKLASVRRESHAIGIPRCGNVSEHGECFRVQHGDGVDAQFRHENPLAVRRDNHPGRTHTAHPFHQRRRNNALLGHNLLLRQINPLDDVVVPIGNKELVAVRGQKVGRTAADRLAVV